MTKPELRRIDYAPGPAASDALREAAELWPDLNLQAQIDRLVISGMSALKHQHWVPPALHGRQRQRWRLPR